MKIKLFKNIGPGIITAALILGPGSLTVSTKLGAGFGFSLLWIIPVAVLFMISFSAMSSNIGLTGDQSLIQLIHARFGKLFSYLIGSGLFLASAAFQAGNSIGTGVALGELTGSSPNPWIVVFTLIAIGLLFFKTFYRILEVLMISLVMLMLVAFALTLFMSRPDFSALLMGLIPSIPDGAELLSIAIVASTFSIGGAFYQSYLVREKGFKKVDAAACQRESRNGILTLGLLTGMVMICASAVLYQSGIEVTTASDLGLALEPLFGSFTSSVFMIGFFAASYSSLVGNATIGGALLSDTLGLGYRLESIKVRSMIIMVMVVGAAIALVFGGIPLELIVVAQGVTIIVVPAAGLGILLIANTRALGLLRNGKRRNAIGVLGLVLLVALAIYNLKILLF